MARKGGFRIRRADEAGCEQIMKRGHTADYAIARVCKTSKGWTYNYVGTRASFPARNKPAAIKAAIRGYQTYMGQRSAFDLLGLGSAKRRKR